MQLLHLPLLLVALLFFLHCSDTRTINNDLGFIHAAKEVVSFVRFDIEELENIEFDATKIRENQLTVIQHFKNVSKQVRQIEQQHVTKPEKWLFYSFTDGAYTSSLNLDVTFSMLWSSFEYMELMDRMEIDTLLQFIEPLSRRRNGLFDYLSRSINEFFKLLLGVECEKFDDECTTTINNLRRFRSMYELPIKKWCEKRQSPQQLLYSLSKQLGLAELMAYILIEYSIMVAKVSKNETYISERDTVRHNYDEITKNALVSLRNVTQKVDRDLWRCDPKSPAHDIDYAEVTRLLQGYIENEVELNNDGSCSATCYDYQNATSTGCFEEKFCSQQPKCSGRIYNCQFVDSDLSVCQSTPNNTRRYEYIQYSEAQRLGPYENCGRNVNKVESWNRWFTQCSYCFCLCDEQGEKSDRYFNLRETLSDIQANKVVTGVRFVKNNRVFHLQIQQGQLLPRGVINNSTVEWKPVNDYEIDGFDNVKEGVDYHTLTYQNRAIDLDDVMTDDRTLVVTGVSFQIVDGHLNLKVRLSKFDFVNGELVNPEINSIWQSKKNVYNRQQLHLDDLDIPTRSLDSSQPISKDTQYLEFINSGMYKDAAQTTIPFIDVQDVASIPPVPLAGIGIYYKGATGYGGFVAPKIISYDISPYLDY